MSLKTSYSGVQILQVEGVITLEPTLGRAGIYKEGLIEELVSYQIQVKPYNPQRGVFQQELDVALVGLLYYRTLI